MFLCHCETLQLIFLILYDSKIDFYSRILSSYNNSFFVGHSRPRSIYFRLFNTVDSKQVNKSSI